MSLTQTIKVRRGNKANLAAASFADGEIGFTEDTKEVYIADAGNVKYLVGSVKTGTDAGKPTAGTGGRIWISTDTHKIYFDDGTAWQLALVSGVATLDDILDGTNYQRVVTAYLTSGKVIKLRNTTAAADASINDSGTTTSDIWTASRIRQEISSNLNGLEYQNSVIAQINYIKTTTGAPTTSGATTGERLLDIPDAKIYNCVSPNTWDAGSSLGNGDRYLFSITGTGSGAGIVSTKTNYIYQNNAGTVATVGDGGADGTLATGWTVSVDVENVEYVFNGTLWVSRPSVTNHNSLSNLQGGQTGEYYHATLAQNQAFAGTNGTPSVSNKFVTDTDPRNTNSRTPTGSTGGDLTGTYPTSLTVAKLNGTALPGSGPTDGQILMYSASGTAFIYTSTIDGGTF